jgi:two-component system, OmpR family, response regulator
MNNSPVILLVEDDESLGFLLKDSLLASGWKVELYTSGEKGLTAFHNNRYDLCLLDVMLPEMDGFDVASAIRKYDQYMPIVFLTARSLTADRIRGFHIGADDYVCKPFSAEELKYRLESILRRAAGSPHQSQQAVLQTGYSILDTENRMLNANGVFTRLTNKECKLLHLLFRHCDRVVDREVFLKSIWEDDGFFVARSMDVFISKLRKYLKNDQLLRIENVRGVGYILKVRRSTQIPHD